MKMWRVFRVVLACVITGHFSEGTIPVQTPCEWSGFGGCECNILGACDTSGKPKPGLDNKLTGYAPSGVEQFRYKKYPGTPPNLAYLCEGNTVAILYDCNAKIPLYAATMMTGEQLAAKYVRPSHLIAARYGRGDNARIRATFTYTNAVPQFGVFNSGAWNSNEHKVVKWGRKNCAMHNGKPKLNVRMYIVVGAIPSTFVSFPRRFFGQSDFSDYYGTSQRTNTYGHDTGRKEYHVNVPRYMWTAVCCTFQFLNGPLGQLQDGLQKMAFYRGNEPGTEPSHTGLIFTAKLPNLAKAVNVFPANSGC